MRRVAVGPIAEPELKALALIGTSFHNRKVRIEDWDALKEIGDFDRRYLQDDLKPEERLRIVN